MVRVKDGYAVCTAYDSFAIEGEGRRAELHRGRDNGWVPAAPIIATSGEQSHGFTDAVDLQPVSDMLTSCTQSGPAGSLAAWGCWAGCVSVGSRQHVSNIRLPNRPATVDLTQRGNCGFVMYQGVERRVTPRHRSLRTGVSLDIKAGAAKLKADRAARIEAELVIDRWNRRLATGRDMLWLPTIRAALIAGTPWLDVFCPAAGRAG